MAPDDRGRFGEDDLLPLSGLQHVVFCDRQAALIHVEQAWAENHLTVEGRRLHEHVDAGGEERRPGVRILRAVPLASTRLGVAGRADVVEMHRQEDGSETPVPVEYKRGRQVKREADDVQVCAQAMCLEEALGVAVPRGAVFYWSSRKRREVPITDALRSRTMAAAQRLRELVTTRTVPRAVPGRKCDACSLREVCLPWTTAADGSSQYVQSLAAP